MVGTHCVFLIHDFGGNKGDAMSYEYKVVPAPMRGLKAKGLKTAEDRFANALQTTMNAQATDGWEYLRADTLPCEQREGLMGKTTVYQNMLVFRRSLEAAKPVVHAPVVTAPAKSGEERLAEKELRAEPKVAVDDKPIDDDEVEVKPIVGKPSSPDVAAQ